MVTPESPTLDLHGVRHDQVVHVVHQFLYDNRDNFPCKLIVGMSEVMRELVHAVLEELGLSCHIEGFTNPGCLVIYTTQWWN